MKASNDVSFAYSLGVLFKFSGQEMKYFLFDKKHV